MLEEHLIISTFVVLVIALKCLSISLHTENVDIEEIKPLLKFKLKKQIYSINNYMDILISQELTLMGHLFDNAQ